MTQSKPGERALRIELIRARAALERQTFIRSAGDLRDCLKPAALVKSLIPRSVSKVRPADLLFQGVSLARRYPLLTSSVSTVLSGVGKRRRWWRIAAGLLVSWQLARSLRNQP